MQEWEWYQNPKMVLLFLHLLLSANHEQGKWQGQTIERGQLITGLDSLHEKTGISVQSIRTCLTKLKSTGEITSKSTNKFRIITLLKYNDYQDKPKKLTSKSTDQLTDHQQTTNKQLTANNNVNNVNKKEQISASAQTFPKNDYIQVTEAYKRIKGVQPQGKEWLPIQAEIKRIFESGRSPAQIIETMEACEDLYDDWTMTTVRAKIADVVAGKIKSKNYQGSRFIIKN